MLCPTGHRFDVAKEGYVNLLPAGRLKGAKSGDDDEMVRARRTVFDAGLYSPIIDAVATTVAATAPANVLDAGCGEGSYLAAITSRTGAEGWGIDISKAAVKSAARRRLGHHYAVASSYLLPFGDHVFDAVVNVFSPRDFDEMFRVLRHDGIAVVVTPGPDHLREVKAAIYDRVRPHDDTPERPDLLAGRHAVTTTVPLPEPAIRLALLHMTPFWWSAGAAGRALLAGTVEQVTLDVRLSVYASHPSPPTR